MPESIHLEPMTEAHLEATRRWLSDAGLRAQVDCLEPPTPTGNRTLWQARWARADREDFAILAADRHVGNCGLCDIDQGRRKAQLWIYLGEGRAQGIGRQALRLLLRRAFVELGLNRVYLRVVADNPRAAAFYRNHGFADEGRLRADSLRAGHAVDALCLAMLADEYAALPSP